MATAEGGHPALAFVRSEIAAKSGTNESADRKTRRPAREPERMGCAEQGSSVTRGSRGAETDAWKHSRSIWRHLWAAPRVFWVTSNPPRAPGQARWRQCCEVRKFIGLLSAPCCCLRPFLRAPGPLPAARSSLGSSLLPRPPPPPPPNRLRGKATVPACLCSHYRERKCLRVRGQVLTAEAEDPAQKRRRPGGRGTANAALGERGTVPHSTLSVTSRGYLGIVLLFWVLAPSPGWGGNVTGHTCSCNLDQPTGRWAGGPSHEP